MRKVVVGLLGVSLAAGMGVSLSPAALAAPPAESPAAASVRASPAPVDDLPNPLEDKRRELREQAVSDVVSGEATPAERSTAARSSRSARQPAPAAGKAAQGQQGTDARPVRRARPREDRPDLRDPGRVRQRAAPELPGQGHRPGHPGPGPVRRPAAQRDPRAGPRGGQLHGLAGRTTTASYYQNLYFGTGRGVESVKTYYETQSSGRYSVDGEVTDWVKVRTTRPATAVRRQPDRRQRRRPGRLRRQRLLQHLGAGPRRRQPVGRRPAGRRPHRRRRSPPTCATFDQWDRYDLDGDGNFNESDGYIDHFQIVHSGGDEADGDPWQGEDAIWSHRWYAFASSIGLDRPADQPARRHPDRQHRHLDRRLHHPAGERRPERLRPRVRPRPRPAGRLRHPQRRRQQQRALDPDGPEPARRQGRRRASAPRRRPRRVEQAAARLARLRDRGGRVRSARSTSARRSTTPPRPQAVVVVLPDKTVDHRPRRAVRRREAVLLRQRRRPGQHDDQDVRPDREDRGRADAQGALQHRGGLRLPLRRGVHRRHHLDRPRTARSTAAPSATTAAAGRRSTAAPAARGWT